jgi:hypothetical protein
MSRYVPSASIATISTTSPRTGLAYKLTDLGQIQRVPEVILNVCWETAQVVLRRSNPDHGFGIQATSGTQYIEQKSYSQARPAVTSLRRALEPLLDSWGGLDEEHCA